MVYEMDATAGGVDFTRYVELEPYVYYSLWTEECRVIGQWYRLSS